MQMLQIMLDHHVYDHSTFKSPNLLVSILDLDSQSVDHLVQTKLEGSMHKHLRMNLFHAFDYSAQTVQKGN